MVGSRVSAGAAIAAVWVCLPTELSAQGAWTATHLGGGPPPLASAAGAFDLDRNHLLLHGGFAANWTSDGRTWRFDGSAWQVQPGPGPSPRGAHAMVGDPVRHGVLLFGGTASGFLATGLADTWWHDGIAWQQLAPAHAPAGRFDHAMAFDFTTMRVMLHGGRPLATGLLGDTWVFDGSDWTQLLVPGPGPGARCRHAMCHDLHRGQTVLFGGLDPTPRSDTWEWNGTGWQLGQFVGPGGRDGHRLVYDLARQCTVLHGGTFGGDETWEWNGVSWTQVTGTATARHDQVMVYDARLQRTTLFGGRPDPTSTLGDVAHYEPPLPGAAYVRGTGCQGSGGVPTLSPVLPNGATGPLLGTTTTLVVAPVPDAVFFVFGLSAAYDGGQPLPLPLDAFGLPGCALRVARDAVTSAPAVGASAAVDLVVPAEAALIGCTLHVQGFPLDPPANPAGFTASNALTLVVGRR